MKGALIVGIEHYKFGALHGCIEDADEMKKVLETNENESPNFECNIICSSEEKEITVSILRKNLEELFNQDSEVALFYFSGHGIENRLGGYLVTQDAQQFDEGVSVVEILTMANNSPAKERIIILDCCFSGHMGTSPIFGKNSETAILNEGVSILTASSANQTAKMHLGRSVFTALLLNGLQGGASDILGNVTVVSLYSYANSLLGYFHQRPLLKTNVRKLKAIRSCNPAVAPESLRKLIKYFKTPDEAFLLDPEFEPDCENQTRGKYKPVLKKTLIFKDLQKFRSLNLIVPVGEEHLFYAAMNSKSCKLTPIGKYYWQLVKEKKI